MASASSSSSSSSSGNSGAPGVFRKKLRKVAEMRTDTPAMLDALDSLALFHAPSNSVTDRRMLRSNLEARGLDLVERFLEGCTPLENAIDDLRMRVEEIEGAFSGMKEALSENVEAIEEFKDATREVMEKKATVEEREKVMDTFLKRFKLSDAQLDALRQGPQAEDEGALFFSALEDVQRIRLECESLIKSQFQSAGLELFDAMASFQEQAYEQLYTWVQKECFSLDADFPEASEALRKGIEVLGEAPAYQDYARDCVSETRKESISNRFVTALTQGSPENNHRPIELHAHDPYRYVGDMLAWLHQAMAVERRLVFSLFKTGSLDHVDRDQNMEGDAEETPFQKNMKMLDAVFEGVSPILTKRIGQVFEATSILLVLFKLMNLLEFYTETFISVMGTPRSRVVDMMRILHKDSRHRFFEIAQNQTDRLLASPPSYPRDLSVALEVSEMLRKLSEILVVQNESLSLNPSDQESARRREDEFAPILDAFIEPLLQMCRQSASGLESSDAAVYIVNNLSTIQSSLTRYDFTVSWVQKLTAEIGVWIDLLVREQTASILGRTGLQEKLDVIKKADDAEPLASLPGMDAKSLQEIMSSFYESMYSLVMPEFDRLASPRLRASARNSSAQAVASAYEEFYSAVANSNSFSEEDVNTILLHDPVRVKQLLDA